MNIIKKFCFVMTFMLLSCPTRPNSSNTIVECYSISDVLQYANADNILMVFDIDNTLAQPVTDVGSSQWFSHRMNCVMGKGLSRIEALGIVLPIYHKIQEVIDLKPVEGNITIDVMKQLKNLNVATIALTSRSYPIAHRTYVQLCNAGIILNAPLAFNRSWQITLKSLVVYQNGILCCDYNDKGTALMNLFDEFSFNPSTVVFINDKQHYLEAVGRACEERGIQFIGLRYNYLDNEKQAYDPIQTENETRSLLNKYMIEDVN